MSAHGVSRRIFLKTGGQATAAFVLGFHLPVRGKAPASRESPKFFRPNAWLKIAADNQVTILVEKPELGQGSRTYTPMIVAEELEVEWASIRVEQAPTIPSVYQGLRTGGSGGVVNTYASLRKVGAQARDMLITAAAQEWKASRKDCRAERGHVVRSSASYCGRGGFGWGRHTH